MKSAARRFVDLVLKHRGTRSQMRMHLKWITDEEKDILFELVRLAGFMPDELVTGKVFGTLTEGGKSKEFLINNVCPFKVVDKRKAALYGATGFLNCAIWSVGAPKVLRKRRYEKLVDYIVSVVKDSIPFDPIKLSQEKDDYLICFTRYGSSLVKPPFFIKRLKDNDAISNFTVGVHSGCCGVMYRDPKEISCARCGLKVSVPALVVTYGDLRRHLLSVAT